MVNKRMFLKQELHDKMIIRMDFGLKYKMILQWKKSIHKIGK